MLRRWLKKTLPNRKNIIKNNSHLTNLRINLDNKNLWRLNRRSVSRGVAAGVFSAFIPLPIQMITAILLSVFIRGNIPIAVLLTWISNPITTAPIIYFTYLVGNFVIGEKTEKILMPEFVIRFDSIHTFLSSSMDLLSHFGKGYFVGLPIVAIGTALICYFLVIIIWECCTLLQLGRKYQTKLMIQAQPNLPWHAYTTEKTFTVFDTQLTGLNKEEALQRLNIYGENTLKSFKRPSLTMRFLAQFNHILIYVLLIAAGITALLKRGIDTGVILAVVFVNAIIGVIQERKAENALEAIRHMLSLKATVIRNGNRELVQSKILVPGDIVLLKSGDKVPADLRLVDSKNLQIQEAILTGESMPVEKSIESVSTDAELGDRTSMAYSGTFVTYGIGIGIVVATGENTEVGKIGAMLVEVSKLETPLLQTINRFSRWLTGIILVAASTAFLFGVLIRGYSMSEMLMAAVGLAVAAIPEGLPAIITITLALGVTRMAKRNAIIRSLPAVETLGSVTVICTDKTGTLTLNELTVQNIITAQHDYVVTGIGYGDQGHFQLDDKIIDPKENVDLRKAIQAALLCNDAELTQVNDVWQLHGNPVDGALLSLCLKAGIDLQLQKKSYPLTDLIPFESEYKFMATMHHDHAGNGYIYVKGAPERILDMSVMQMSEGKHIPVDKSYWRSKIESLSSEGKRVIAVGMCLTSEDHDELQFSDIENKLIIVAIFGLLDSPREEAIKAITECLSAGIQIKMITGDYAATAKSVAKQLGIKYPENVLTGYEIDKLNSNEFSKIVDKINIFARTSPEHKLQLVKILQAKNNIVAMTGDGVNDAPALKRADIGIAMGQKGTEVAKEAAEIVLTDDNFASIISTVKEGRTVYDNIVKTILFILPTDGGEGLILMTAILFGWTLPITPIQILWVNMITAVTLSLALAFEPAEKNIMHRPPRRPDASILSPLLIWRTIFVSLLLLLGGFGLFSFAQEAHASLETARTITVNVLVIGEIAYLLNTRKLFTSSFSLDGIFGSKPVMAAVLIVIIFQIIFTYVPWMQRVFETASLDLKQWLSILSFGIGIFILVEVEKFITRKFLALHREKS